MDAPRQVQRRRRCGWLPFINAEPVMFLLAIYIGVFGAFTSAFVYFKICVIQNAHRPDVEQFCHQLGKNNDSDDSREQKEVEAEASYFSVYITIFQTVPTIFAAFSIGAWSDNHGRKPMLILALSGYVLAILTWLISAQFIYSPTWIILLGYLFSSCTGSQRAIITLVLSSVRDSFNDSGDVSVRISWIASAFSVGMVIGSLADSFAIRQLSYAYIIMISLVVTVLNLLYVVLILRETSPGIKQRTATTTSTVPYESLVNEDNVGEVKSSHVVSYPDPHPEPQGLMWKCMAWLATIGPVRVFATLAKKRPQGRRRLILVGLFAYLLLVTVDMGIYGLLLLFVKYEPLDWSDRLWALHTAFNSALPAVTVPLLNILFKKVINLHDTVLVGFGVTALIGRYTLTSISKTTLMVFIATAFQSVGGLSFSNFRSYLSLLVEKNETGKLFSCITVLENVGVLIASAIFYSIYPLTLTFFPGLVFAVAAVLLVILLVLVIYLYYGSRSLTTTQSCAIEEVEEATKHSHDA